jgi:hypothetical protein
MGGARVVELRHSIVRGYCCILRLYDYYDMMGIRYDN